MWYIKIVNYIYMNKNVDFNINIIFVWFLILSYFNDNNNIIIIISFIITIINLLLFFWIVFLDSFHLYVHDFN